MLLVKYTIKAPVFVQIPTYTCNVLVCQTIFLVPFIFKRLVLLVKYNSMHPKSNRIWTRMGKLFIISPNRNFLVFRNLEMGVANLTGHNRKRSLHISMKLWIYATSVLDLHPMALFNGFKQNNVFCLEYIPLNMHKRSLCPFWEDYSLYIRAKLTSLSVILYLVLVSCVV